MTPSPVGVLCLSYTCSWAIFQPPIRYIRSLNQRHFNNHSSILKWNRFQCGKAIKRSVAPPLFSSDWSRQGSKAWIVSFSSSCLYLPPPPLTAQVGWIRSASWNRLQSFNLYLLKWHQKERQELRPNKVQENHRSQMFFFPFYFIIFSL